MLDDLKSRWYTEKSQFLLESGFFLVAVLFFSISAILPKAVTYSSTLLLFLGVSFPALKKMSLPGHHIKWLSIGFSAYMLSALFSLVNTQNWHTGDWDLERYGRFLLVIPLVVFVIRSRISAFLPLVIGALLGVFVYSVHSYYNVEILNKVRVDLGHFLNANRYGELAFINTLILLSAALLFPMAKHYRILCLISSLLGIYAGICSGSRGALLAFIVSTGFLVIKSIGLFSEKWRFLVAMTALCALFAGLTSLITFSDHWRRQLPRLITMPIEYFRHNYQTDTSSIHVRMALAQGGLLIWKRNPILGTGLGDTGNDMKILAREQKVPGGLDWGRVHNSYIDALSKCGLVGLAAFIIGIFIIPYRAYAGALARARSPGEKMFAPICGIAVLVFFAVDALASSCFSNKGLYPYLVCTSLLLGISLRDSEDLEYDMKY